MLSHKSDPNADRRRRAKKIRKFCRRYIWKPLTRPHAVVEVDGFFGGFSRGQTDRSSAQSAMMPVASAEKSKRKRINPTTHGQHPPQDGV